MKNIGTEMIKLKKYNKQFTIISMIFIIHLLMVFILIPWFVEQYPKLYQIDKFPDGYDKVATNLAEGRGYRIFEETSETAMRPPGYVFLLAIIFKMVGKNLIVVQIINIVLICLSCIILWNIAQQVIPDIKYPFLPSLIFSFHPGIFLLESRAGLECLFIFMCVSFVYFFYRSLQNNKKLFFALAGAFWGLTALVKSTIIIVIPILVLYLAFKKFRYLSVTEIITRIMLFLTIGIIFMAPWIIRNYYLTTKIIPTTTTLGHTIYQGIYINENINTEKEHYQLLNDATNELNDIAEKLNLRFIKGFGQYFYNVNDEVFFNQYITNLSKEKFINSPAFLIKNCVLNFIRFWFQGRSKKSTILNTIITLPILCMVVCGIYYGYKNKLCINPIVIFIVFYVLGHLPIMGVARYHIPLIPIIAILCSIFIDKKIARA